MAFGGAKAMQKKWNDFCRKIDMKSDDFGAVLRVIKAFLAEPFAASVQNKEFAESWSAFNEMWNQTEE